MRHRVRCACNGAPLPTDPSRSPRLWPPWADIGAAVAAFFFCFPLGRICRLRNGRLGAPLFPALRLASCVRPDGVASSLTGGDPPPLLNAFGMRDARAYIMQLAYHPTALHVSGMRLYFGTSGAVVCRLSS